MLEKALQRLPRPLRLIIAAPLIILIAPFALIETFVPPSWLWLPVIIGVLGLGYIDYAWSQTRHPWLILMWFWDLQLIAPCFGHWWEKEKRVHALYCSGVKLEDLKAQIDELRQKAEELETLQSLTLDSEQLKALSFIVDRAVERQSRLEFWRDVAKDLAINAAFTIIGFILGRRF